MGGAGKGHSSDSSSVAVAVLLLLPFEAPLAGFTHIGRESFEKRLEVPSTSRVIVGLKTLGLLVVGPQHGLEAQNFVSVSQNGPSRCGGSGSNTSRCYLDGESR